MSNRNIIIEETRTALERDPRIAHAAAVAVAEREGRVTLRGTVRSMHQRRTAVAIARSARGVRAVEDGLRIDPRDHARTTRSAAPRCRPCRTTAFRPGSTSPSRTAGRPSRARPSTSGTSDAAFAAASEIAGVGGITNRITVVSPGADR